jgi:DNA repair photolyase
MAKVAVVKASRGKIVVGSGFQGYDVCVNPWVGCQFGCSYCYVRFFVKDPKLPWGQFVRARDHLPVRLAREIGQGVLAGKRVVLGTIVFRTGHARF